jgi:DNA-binding MarR family transcriptional regulator
MPFDAMVANAGRLHILAALAGTDRMEFVHLRQATKLTDGNLASHARRLAAAGFVAIEKQFRAGKSVTRFALTPTGRNALETHVRTLMQAVTPAAMSTHAEVEIETPAHDPALEEQWVD